MKEQNEKEKQTRRKSGVKGERRFYLFTAIGCAVALVAIVIVAVAVSSSANLDTPQAGNSTVGNSNSAPSQDVGGEQNPDDNEQVVVTPEGMIMPIESVALINEYGFYYNKTLNSYYEHKGLDFAAEAGASVLAVEDGQIESIYKGDLLSGTEIVVSHGDGLKSVYRFVTEAEGLAVGDSVKKGDVIATVAEANGDEYKDGAHLHFEVLKEGVQVDPAVYLTLEEK